MRPQGFQPLDLADRLAIVYLALPSVIFLLGWFSPLVGAVLALLLLAALLPAITTHGDKLHFDASWGVVLVSVAVALGWSALGGAGHFFYANLDWHTRDAVLRDLVVSGWPPSYGVVGGQDLILRTPVAYYLPAALLGKIFGLPLANLFLFIWTALGVAIFFLIALSGKRTTRHVYIAVPVVVFFSGLDAFGTERYFLDRPGLTEHLEWWARIFQYSANTTQLFWVPNHALPGWLSAALIYRHWRNAEFLKIAPIAFAATALWSPLVSIGLAPFAILVAVHGLRHDAWRSPGVLLSLVGASTTFAVTAYYLLLDAGGIRSGSTVSGAPSVAGFATLYLKFILLEFGFIAAAISLIRRDVMMLVAIAFLLVLPLYSFGPGNDLVMRASIPALMILCLMSADALSHLNWRAQPKLVMPLLFCLTFGSITAIHEITRSLLYSRWSPQLERNLVEVSRGVPTHYVAQLSPFLARFMRPPPAGSRAKYIFPASSEEIDFFIDYSWKIPSRLFIARNSERDLNLSSG